MTAQVADKSHDHDQRAGRGFAQGQAVDHLRGRDPAKLFNRALVHIRQYRISPAKGEQGGLAEKPGHLRQGVVPTPDPHQAHHRQGPQHSAHAQHLQEAPQREMGVGLARRVVANQR